LIRSRSFSQSSDPKGTSVDQQRELEHLPETATRAVDDDAPSVTGRTDGSKSRKRLREALSSLAFGSISRSQCFLRWLRGSTTPSMSEGASDARVAAGGTPMVTEPEAASTGADVAALSTYLERHLAGSETAVRLTEGLLDRASDPEELEFLRRFSLELEQERTILRSTLDGLHHDKSLVQRGIGIATGVAAMVKATLPSSEDELEALEALAVGVWGKRLLWGALQTIADADDRFAGLPLGALSRQAEEQERQLLGLRQEAIATSLLS
jgi:hypothetical protein